VQAFSSDENGGNPAGVVLEPNHLTDEQMKTISKRLGVSETAYVFPSKKANYSVRFFSPAVEVDLCGHATIATFTVIGNQLKNDSSKSVTLTQETKVGILPVRLFFTNEKKLDFVLMKQHSPIFEDVSYNSETLAEILNIPVDTLSDNLPKQRVSTGLFTLPICVNSLHTLEKMKPDFHRVKQFCKALNVGSLHVFSFETYESDSLYHARNFAPLYDINEDPVTGTANGAVSSYLRYHQLFSTQNIICEQGDIIGKKGRVRVCFKDNEVWVGGQATIKECLTLDI
jgi:PhzF family phenazine biosynthesis protein